MFIFKPGLGRPQSRVSWQMCPGVSRIWGQVLDLAVMVSLEMLQVSLPGAGCVAGDNHSSDV